MKWFWSVLLILHSAKTALLPARYFWSIVTLNEPTNLKKQIISSLSLDPLVLIGWIISPAAGHGRQFLVSQGANGIDGEPYDHGKDTEEFFKVTKDFYAAMKADTTVVITYEVKMVSKV